jgi:hypothetical protein
VARFFIQLKVASIPNPACVYVYCIHTIEDSDSVPILHEATDVATSF